MISYMIDYMHIPHTLLRLPATTPGFAGPQLAELLAGPHVVLLVLAEGALVAAARGPPRSSQEGADDRRLRVEERHAAHDLRQRLVDLREAQDTVVVDVHQLEELLPLRLLLKRRRNPSSRAPTRLRNHGFHSETQPNIDVFGSKPSPPASSGTSACPAWHPPRACPAPPSAPPPWPRCSRGSPWPSRPRCPCAPCSGS